MEVTDFGPNKIWKISFFNIITAGRLNTKKNGIWGRKDGISLVRRDIAVEVAQYLRGAIIEMSKSSDSKKNQETKQARIYDYVTSREFGRKIESLERDNSEMMKLQLESEVMKKYGISKTVGNFDEVEPS